MKRIVILMTVCSMALFALAGCRGELEVGDTASRIASPR
jgi:hypothetical protein